MIDSAVQATSRQIVQQMDLTWQRLPVSHQFEEPLPLSVTVDIHNGRQIANSSRHASPLQGVLHALQLGKLPLYLQARPGGGKSSALRWIARQLAAAAAADQTTWLPVYIDLGQVGQELSGQSLTELVDAQLAKTAPIDYRPYQNHEATLLVLLDGLDLLNGPLSPRKLLEEALVAPRGAYVLAGRRNDELEQQLDDWPVSLRLTLESLSRVERENWFAQHASQSAQDKLFSIIAANRHVETLLENPLLFAMTASACIDAPEQADFQTDQYPGRSGIFAGFVDYSLLRARWHGRLPAHSLLVAEPAFVPFEQLCLAAARRGFHDRLPKNEMPSLASDRNDRVTPSPAWNPALQMCLAGGLLEDAGSNFRFLHQQFAEYFAAREVARQWSQAHADARFDAAFVSQLKLRMFDPISIHALAILSTQPDHLPLLDRSFQILADVDVPDACEIHASTGAETFVPLIAGVLENDRYDPLTCLAAIEALATLPHPKSVAALVHISTTWYRYPEPLVRGAIVGLGHLFLHEARAELDNLARQHTLPSWVRMAALHAGANLPIAEALDLAAHIAVDENAAEDVRTDAVEWLGNQESESAERILGSIGASPSLSLALRLNIEAAIHRHRIRRMQSQNVNAPSPHLSLAPLNEMIRRAQLVGRMSPESSPVKSDLAPAADPTSDALNAAEMMGSNLSTTQVEALLRQVLSNEASQSPEANQLLSHCRRDAYVWNVIENHPLAHGLSPSLLTTCARVAGCRWFPPALVKTVTPQPAETVESTDRSGKSRGRQEPLGKEAVMVEYLAECRKSKQPATLDGAVRFARSRGVGWSRSTLQTTAAWEKHQANLGK